MIIKDKGFTLIEALVALVLLGIFIAIAIPTASSIFEDSKKEACYAEILLLEKSYERYLIIEGVEHLDTLFDEYLALYVEEEPCDGICDITYVDDKILCDKYFEEDEGDSGIPYL